MRKSLVVLLSLCLTAITIHNAYSQDIVIINKKCAEVIINKAYVDYFTRNIHNISSYNGQTEVWVPYKKRFFLETKTMKTGNYLFQYDDKSIADIKFKKSDCWYKIFDFRKDTIKDQKHNNNDKDFKKPSEKDLIDKIKKHKNKEGKKNEKL